ncbi:nucleic acid-binding, OB-fold protein [Tanacetum coccineum]
MNNKLYLSSTSSTLILDHPEIPALMQFKKEISEGGVEVKRNVVHVNSSEPRDRRLENQLMWDRNRKKDVRLFLLNLLQAITTHLPLQSATFICKIRIDDVMTKKGWNYPSCGSDTCKKGITRKLGSFWCGSCNKAVEYPVLRISHKSPTDELVCVGSKQVSIVFVENTKEYHSDVLAESQG